VDSALGRLLLFDLRMPVVAFGAPSWRVLVTNALAMHGVVRVTVAQSEQAWKASLTGLLSMPIVSGFLQFFPMVEAIRSLDNGQIAIDLLLRERV
jgi:hypothetical protein